MKTHEFKMTKTDYISADRVAEYIKLVSAITKELTGQNVFVLSVEQDKTTLSVELVSAGE